MMVPSGPEDLSLRPAANSMVLKPQAPSMVPKNMPTANRPISMTKNEAPPITKVRQPKRAQHIFTWTTLGSHCGPGGGHVSWCDCAPYQAHLVRLRAHCCIIFPYMRVSLIAYY